MNTAPTPDDREFAGRVMAAGTLEQAAALVAQYRSERVEHDRRQSRAIAEGYKARAEEFEARVEQLEALCRRAEPWMSAVALTDSQQACADWCKECWAVIPDTHPEGAGVAHQ